MVDGKRLDIIVFGATGCTGGYVVENLVKTIDKENADLTWGVAGRSEKKTRDVLDRASSYTGTSLDGIEVIVADVGDEDSILKMCERGRIIINCVGPYSLYGEVVVKNCILAKSHHVDLADEPLFIEKMQFRYHKKAVEAGVLIVSACGFGSIPVDLGILELQNKCSGEIAWIETFAKITSGESGSVINRATWDSTVQFIADLGDLKQYRRALYRRFFVKYLPTFKHKCSQKYLPYTPPGIGELTVPFWGTDKLIVDSTQYQKFIDHDKRPVQMAAYFVVGSWFKALGLGIIALLFGIFSWLAFGRKLLNKYPSFFTVGLVSENGPTRKQVDETSFEITIVGHGWKDKLQSPSEEPNTPPTRLISGRWRGPEASCAATSIIVIQAAITILKEIDAIEYKVGVLTPGLVFEHTSLISRLRRHAVVFEIIEK